MTFCIDCYIHAKRDKGNRQKKKKKRRKPYPLFPQEQNKRPFNNPRPAPYPRDIRLARWDPPRVSRP